ncbi:hypothetical protein PCANC_12302 [Puccinia coronata f. sp. avenae]|uniref:HAT C-terminal dimerisation domain-containing protein n=1 Tax=Puccinia coronata f. sp. avenae TaxID=200324 RepID=A0A2N5SU15_9BASI|nr:hypothetical protein PCANC_12302 [Puccinia coronata f. sp. avenae]
MASEVNRLILNKTGIDINLSENHIRCFCHKIALILNAGLKSIKLAANKLITFKESTLGFVPGLSPIEEESEESEKTTDQFVQEDVFLDKDSSNTDEAGDDGDGLEREPPVPTPSSNKIHRILEKVDFIIQQITSSAAKRFEYDTWCKKLDYNGPSLIAGYGIQWNIKFESRNGGYQARKVIAKLIENERDRQEREGGKNYYNNMEITQSKWDVVNKLNETLSVS